MWIQCSAKRFLGAGHRADTAWPVLSPPPWLPGLTDKKTSEQRLLLDTYRLHLEENFYESRPASWPRDRHYHGSKKSHIPPPSPLHEAFFSRGTVSCLDSALLLINLFPSEKALFLSYREKSLLQLV